MSGQLASIGTDGKAARRILARYVENTYLADEKVARSISFDGWRGFLQCLAPDLPAQTRKAWAQRLRAVFAPDAEARLALTTRRFERLPPPRPGPQLRHRPGQAVGVRKGPAGHLAVHRHDRKPRPRPERDVLLLHRRHRLQRP